VCCVDGLTGFPDAIAAVADLVAADRDQSGEPIVIRTVGDDTLDDPPDGVPADSEQPADRGLGHLLRKPRDNVFEVAGMMSVRPRPRHRLGPDDPAVGQRSIRNSHAITQRVAPRSRWRQRLTRRSWITSWRPVCPQRAHTRRRQRNRTPTITPSPPKLTSMTEAPRRRSSLLKAVVTRMSPSSRGR
jgi:hypothetical protein